LGPATGNGGNKVEALGRDGTADSNPGQGQQQGVRAPRY
jgi:hypothetical protein